MSPGARRAFYLPRRKGVGYNPPFPWLPLRPVRRQGTSFAEVLHREKETKVSGRKLFRAAALAAGFFFGAVAVWAQGGGTASAGSAPAAPLQKIGVINIRQAIIATAEGKQASAELQSKYAPRQNELQNLNKEIEDLRSRLNAGERTLSDEEKERLQRQGQQRARLLDRKQNEYQEDLNAEQGEIIDRIGRKMLEVLDRYARENGYVAVLDTSAQNTPILYASSQIDITQDIVRLYDQANPIKAGAAAAPAQPRPAQPKPAQPGQQKPPQR